MAIRRLQGSGETLLFAFVAAACGNGGEESSAAALDQTGVPSNSQGDPTAPAAGTNTQANTAPSGPEAAMGSQGWESIRCFNQSGGALCYGTNGDYSAFVVPDCAISGLTGEVVSPEPALHQCGMGPDALAGWDELTCLSRGAGVTCYGRRGDWWSAIVADCGDLIRGPMISIQSAGSRQCGQETDNGGFEETVCTEPDVNFIECNGRIGQYWIEGGVIPNCEVDALIAERGEANPSSFPCP
jgi:hypothetical protein